MFDLGCIRFILEMKYSIMLSITKLINDIFFHQFT